MLKAFAGGRVFGTVHGSGRPRVLALPGWQRDHDDFDRVLTGLDAIAVDPPGFGSTPPPDEAWGSAEYASAISPVLSELSRPVVLGHSFGGRIALHLAATHGDVVGALVLSGVPQLLKREKHAMAPLPFRVARAFQRRGVITEQRVESMRQRYRWGSDDYRAATGVLRGVLVRVTGEDYEAQLSTLRCPVEFVWGSEDTAAPLEMVRRAADLVAHAKLTVLDGVGHMTPIDAPEELRAAIVRHL